MLAQLRDVLAAEDSSIVTQKQQNGWFSLPKRAQPYLVSARFRQNDWR
jgi:hypothetical protein